MKNILVIDGNNIIHRAFYGIRPLSTRDGRPTNAIYGMLHIIQKQIDTLHPDYCAVAFDLKAPTFRHLMYPEYKAGRHETPEELKAQFDDAKECLKLMGLHILELEGYEADDIQGTVAYMAHSIPDCHAYILSGDRDLFQMIDDKISVIYAGMDTVVFNRKQFMDKYPGVTPEQFVDLKAIMGDTSDHIPGVPGIGEKGAINLITTFGSLDGVYEHLDSDSITKGVRNKLIEGKESAYMSQTLSRILKDIPLNKTLEDLKYHGPNSTPLKEKLIDLELHSFIQKMNLLEVKDEEITTSTEEVLLKELQPSELAQLDSLISFHFTDGKILLSDSHGDYLFQGTLEDLKPVFEGDYHIVLYSAKPIYRQLLKLGIRPSCTFEDIMLFSYVLDSSKGGLVLSNLCISYLRSSFTSYEQVAHFLLPLREAMLKEIKEHQCEKLLYDIELPLMPILAKMEDAGFQLDQKGLEKYGEEMKTYLEKTTQAIYEKTGYTFNINSPKQLADILFEKLGIPYPNQKGKNASYSTDAETLEKLLPNEIIQLILDYRQISKLYSTYVQGLLGAVEEDGRLHTDFKQALTATGRLSSTEPNLQNIPIRTPVGRELRRYFVAHEGNVLVDADYSQIELRLMAVLSQDQNMIDGFNSGIDIHTITASTAFGIPIDEVTPEIRKKAKAINFGILYGIGPFSLSQDLHISQREAKEYIENYLNTYPKISSYLDQVVSDAEMNGYSTTYYGRRRYIPELKDSKAFIRANGKRIAMNAPIQGTAADIMKLAMIKTNQVLQKEVPSASLIMQVHDELVVECKAEDQERVSKILKDCMENIVQFSVPLTVDVESGQNWFM